MHLQKIIPLGARLSFFLYAVDQAVPINFNKGVGEK